MYLNSPTTGKMHMEDTHRFHGGCTTQLIYCRIEEKIVLSDGPFLAMKLYKNMCDAMNLASPTHMHSKSHNVISW